MDQPATTTYGAEFRAALRRAVSRSGLSLEQICAELRQVGTPVSVSALSSWQTGANHPERSSSLAALTQLEALLRISPGTLADLLPPRRPRGKRLARRSPAAVSWEHLWDMPESIVRALAKLDARPDDVERVLTVSSHATRFFNRDGHQVAVRRQNIIRAEADTDRIIHLSRCDSLPQPPAVTDAKGCRLGRFRADVATATCVFEFVLDHPLRAGDLGVIEFTRRYPPGQAATRATLVQRRPLRDLTVQVCFDPQRLPVRCYSYYQSTLEDPERVMREFSGPEVTPNLQFVSIDTPPGIHGVRWHWP